MQALIPELRSYSLLPAEEFQHLLVARLAEVGVALVVLPHLKNTCTQGATFWMRPDKAVLMMTIRGSWADIFWFSLFHEIGHILKHGKKMFLEEGTADNETQAKEDEADAFACDTLIPARKYQSFIEHKDISASSIAKFAEEIGIAAGIITGRLQHDDYLAPNYHLYRERYKWAG